MNHIAPERMIWRQPPSRIANMYLPEELKGHEPEDDIGDDEHKHRPDDPVVKRRR